MAAKLQWYAARALILAGVLAAAPVASGQEAPAEPAAKAVAAADRPAEDRMADPRRKPAETVAFAGVQPGQTVVELFPGGGYFTRVLSRVVGPNGRLILIPWGEPQSGKSRMLAADPAYGNITFFGENLVAFRPAKPVDMVFTVQNYHDIGTPQRAQVNQLIFRWLKPGGTYFIVDHAGAEGSGYASLPLHRIDEALLRQEVEAAGFVLAGSSDLLRNPSDDRHSNVFSPVIRGKSDQFVLRFVKPATAPTAAP